jgi:hypothetical protein
MLIFRSRNQPLRVSLAGHFETNWFTRQRGSFGPKLRALSQCQRHGRDYHAHLRVEPALRPGWRVPY